MKRLVAVARTAVLALHAVAWLYLLSCWCMAWFWRVIDPDPFADVGGALAYCMLATAFIGMVIAYTPRGGRYVSKDAAYFLFGMSLIWALLASSTLQTLS